MSDEFKHSIESLGQQSFERFIRALFAAATDDTAFLDQTLASFKMQPAITCKAILNTLANEEATAPKSKLIMIALFLGGLIRHAAATDPDFTEMLNTMEGGAGSCGEGDSAL